MLYDMAIVFGFPIVVLIIVFAYATFRRYLKHKERMAMIAQGIKPDDWEPITRHIQPKGSSPIVVTLVGIAITIGLSTIGIGPWLIGGLVPTAIGCAMLIGQILEERKGNKEDKSE